MKRWDQAHRQDDLTVTHDYTVDTEGKLFHTGNRHYALERFVRDTVDGKRVKFWCDGERYFTLLSVECVP